MILRSLDLLLMIFTATMGYNDVQWSVVGGSRYLSCDYVLQIMLDAKTISNHKRTTATMLFIPLSQRTSSRIGNMWHCKTQPGPCLYETVSWVLVLLWDKLSRTHGCGAIWMIILECVVGFLWYQRVVNPSTTVLSPAAYDKRLFHWDYPRWIGSFLVPFVHEWCLLHLTIPILRSL